MKNIGWLFALLALFSCNRDSMKKQLSNFIGTEIVFPGNLQSNLQGRDTLIHFTDAPMKMVVWYDSVECASCRIQQLHEWNEIIRYANETGEIFRPVFIFSPKVNDLHSVNYALHMSDFEHPVYIDKENIFRKNNHGIPPDERMHTFLLDENNKVVLVGSPLRNKPLWELYKEQIESIIQ